LFVLFSQNFIAQAAQIDTKENAAFADMAVKYLGPSVVGYRYGV